MHSVTELRCGARYYGLAITQHFGSQAQGFDVDAANYIKAQCSFVLRNPEMVWRFLKKRGVAKLHWKYLQYFFSIDPPVYKPFEELWFFCFDGMKADGSLPANARETLVRLLNDKRYARPLYLQSAEEGVKCSTN